MGQRDSGYSVVSSIRRWPDTAPARSLRREMELGSGQTRSSFGAYANRRLNLTEAGKAQGRIMAETPNRTWENWLSGIIGGPPETWQWWKCEPVPQSKERER